MDDIGKPLRRRRQSLRRQPPSAKAKAAEGRGATAPAAPRGAALVFELQSKSGVLTVRSVASRFGMSRRQLASTAGIKLSEKRGAARAELQERLQEMLEIVGRVADWAGGPDQAMVWYRAEPLQAFGGRTAESLVKSGQAAAVRDYLDHVALGGFA